MNAPAIRTILLIGICLLSGFASSAQEPDTSVVTVSQLPPQRTAVYVWPIMRVCRPDTQSTDAVAARLGGDVRLQVHRLAPPSTATFQSCLGASCAELLNSEGCEKRSGILVGGEVDEEACNVNDKSLEGCTGQLLTRIRVYRVDLVENRPTQGDYLYALCQDQRCGAEARSVEETTAQLIEQLVNAQSLPNTLGAPRATPAPDELCSGSATATPAPQPAQSSPSPAIELPGTVVAYAYYTQYKHLAGSKDAAEGAQYPTRDAAESAAKQRALHFFDGVSFPNGPQYINKTVNTKYTLLPGEDLVGNTQRTAKLQSYLSTAPEGPEYAPLRQAAAAHKALLALVLDDETKSLATFLFTSGKALRPVPTPEPCQAGGGESPACVQAAVTAALLLTTEKSTAVTAPAPAALVRAPLRPLGCIPYRERKCAAMCGSAPAVAATPQQALPTEVPPLPPPKPPRRLAEGFLYGAMGVALATAIGLSIADAAVGPIQISNDNGDMAVVGGLLRPAVWTAWGLTIALAVPAVITLADRIPAKASITETPYTPPAPAVSLCPIGEAH